jgi:hypothetical protein
MPQVILNFLILKQKKLKDGDLVAKIEKRNLEKQLMKKKRGRNKLTQSFTKHSSGIIRP